MVRDAGAALARSSRRAKRIDPCRTSTTWLISARRRNVHGIVLNGVCFGEKRADLLRG
jgi:hypothetical protein